MNSSAKVSAAIQSVALAGGAAAVAFGAISADQQATLTNSIVTLAGVVATIWGAWSNHKSAGEGK